MIEVDPPDLQLSSQLSKSSFNHQVKEIVETNLRTGRFQRVCNFLGKPLTSEEYTDLVANHYAAHHDLVSQLMQGNQGAWEQLWKWLFRAAYTLLLRRNWDSEDAYIRAQEATQDTCLSIYCQVYPYDCSFDAWTLTILRHHVFRSHHRPRNPLDLPDVVEPLEKSPQLAADFGDLVSIEQLEPLLRAISQLRSPAQQQVIDFLFFQGLSSEETAKKLNKTTQAIYNLKERALANLRALLQAEKQ